MILGIICNDSGIVSAAADGMVLRKKMKGQCVQSFDCRS
jgi:hypothetical protein